MLSFMDSLYVKGQVAWEHFLHDERGEVNVVAIVMLIAVAVVLALFFKEKIGDLLETMLEAITNKATTALEDI